MSTTIDQKVVEMRFDNKDFESNVSTSMSTLDKLKQKLNLTGASKGLENVGSAVNKVNVSGLSDAINTVSSRFSALEVMGVTALANISNQAVNAGKRLIASFTIDPVKTGFNEYELKMGSVQTIMASTGESLETVNKYLEELNKYSDQTIYSFSDMTQNIGKFTNAGVKLEDAVLAIKGISNEAAVSGANANEAARAMFNFSQALSAGFVQTRDWMSIENANMATVEFKNELIKAAVEVGTLTEAADGMYETLDGKSMNATKNFRDTLQDQWMTSEVLIKALGKYADETTEIGAKASAAATEVKTFSMMMDTLKEAAQSGWAQTWEIIFGDFNEGKALWTSLSNTFGGWIDTMSKARNNSLKGALDSNEVSWDKLIKKVNEAGIETEHFQNGLIEVARKHNIAIDDMIEKEGSFVATLKSGWLTSDIIVETLEHFAGGTAKTAESTEDMTDALKKYQKVVDEVWYGKYKNAPDRQELLTKAGYDYAVVQALVNKTEGKRKVTMRDLIETQGALSDAQLKNMGYTDEQVKSIRKLADTAKKTGTPINELIQSMSKPSGRELLLESLGRIGKSCITIFKSMGKAWKEVFPKDTAAKSKILYSIIESFNAFTKELTVNEKAADKFKRTFKGVFALLDIVLKLVSGPVSIAFKLFLAILRALDIPILDFTASIGDAIVALNNWLDRVLDFDKAAEVLIAYCKKAKDAIVSWFEALHSSDTIFGKITRSIVSFFKKSKDALMGWIEELKKSDNIPEDIIMGMVNGFNKYLHLVVDKMKELGKKILTTIKDILGIHSPSKEFFEIAWNCIEGFINGIKAGFSAVWKVIKSLGSGIIKILKKIDFGQIIAAAIGIGAIVAAFKLANALEALTSPLEGVGDMMEGIGKAASGLGAKFRGDAMKSMAISIAILVGSLIALGLALKFMNPADLWHAVGLIAALAVVLGLLAFAMSRLSQDTVTIGKKGISSSSTSGIFAKIAIAILLVAAAVKIMSGMNLTEAVTGFIGLIAVCGAMLGFTIAVGKLVTVEKHFDKVGSMLLKMSLALLLMVGVAKAAASLSKLTDAEIGACAAFVAGIGLLFVTIGAVVKKSYKGISGAGSMLLKMSIAMLLMIVVVKQAASLSKLSDEEISTAIGFIGLVGILFVTMGAVVKKSYKAVSSVGTMLLKMSLAILLMVGIAKLSSKLKPNDIWKAIGFMTVLTALAVGMKWAVGKVGKNLDKVGTTMIKLSIAILLLTGVAYLLSLLPWQKALQGCAGVVSLLGGIALVLWAGSAIKPSAVAKLNKTLIIVTVAIGLMGAILIALSFIKPEKAMASMVSLSGVMVALAAVMWILGEIKISKTIFKSLVVMASAIAVIGGMLFLVGQLPIEKTFVSMVALSGVLLALAGAMQMLKKVKIDKSLFANLILVASAIPVIGGTLFLVGQLPIAKALVGTLALIVVMGAMLGFMFVAKKVGTISKTLQKTIWSMILVIAAFAAIVALLSVINATNALVAVVAMGLLMAEILIFIEVLKRVSSIQIDMTSLISLAVTLGIFTLAIMGLGMLNAGQITSSMLALASSMVIMVAALKLIPKDASASVLALVGVAAAMVILSAVIQSMASMSWEEIARGLVAFAGALLVITVALQFVSGSVTGALALLVIAAALMVLAPALLMLGSMSIGEIVGALLALAGTLVIMGVAAAVLTPFIPMMLLLAAVIVMLGAGFLIAGGGAMLFATALTMLASVNLILIGAGMYLLAQSFVMLGVAGLLLYPVASAITIFAVAMVVLGAGMALTVATIPLFVAAIQILCSFNLLEVAVSVLALAGAFAVLSVAGAMLVPISVAIALIGAAMLPLGVGLALASAASSLFVSSMSTLASLDLLDVSGSLLALAAATLAFSAAAFVMIPAVPGILLMSTALTVLGAALIVLGTGLSVASASVLAFAVAIKALTSINFGSVTSGIVDEFVSGIASFSKSITEAGKDLVKGLINGIKSMIGGVAKAAKSIGSKAVSSIKSILGINSPSKVFAEIGKFSGQGLIKGLKGMSRSISRTSSDLGNTAATSMTNAVSRIADAINSDIDSQPTIRPVLDLSDVRSGARSINGMFPGRTLSVNTRTVGAIAGSMAGYQNGNNSDEIVSGIKALRKDLAETPRNSYSINGITYDDGSNVASAIETLVRAARIERRT